MNPILPGTSLQNNVKIIVFSLVVIATHKEDDGGDDDDEEDEELPEDELNTSKAKNRKKSGNVSFDLSTKSNKILVNSS